MPAASLLARSRTGRGCRRGALWRAQIPGRAGLGDLVDHEFQRGAAAASVEEDGFVDRAILLLEAVVVSKDVQGVLVLLGVGVLQHELNGTDFGAAALALHGEFKIIALANVAKLIDFVVVAGNQRAHLAAGHLNAVFGGVKVAFYS